MFGASHTGASGCTGSARSPARRPSNRKKLGIYGSIRTGIVLTKLDGTAKGGIVIAVADTLQIPVKLIGVGEQIDDLMPFQPADFVQALL